MKTPSQVFEEIFKQSYPLIENYKEDLTVCDKNWFLEEYVTGMHSGFSAIHLTYKNGTRLISLPRLDAYPPAGKSVRYLFGYANRDHALGEKLESIEHLINDNYRPNLRLILFVGKMGDVSEITKEKAVSIVRDYVQNMRKQFQEDNGVRV